MGVPHEDLLKKFEALRGQPKRFQDRLDAERLDSFVLERTDLQGGHVNLVPRSTQRNPTGPFSTPGTADTHTGPLATPGVDPLDGDVLTPEFLDFKDLDQRKLDLPCIIEHNPSKQALKKFGVDEQREVIFHFPYTALKDLGLVTEARFRGLEIGDFVEWDGTWYVIWSVHRKDYFGQTDRFFFTSGAANRYRLDSVNTSSNKEKDC